VALVGDGAFQMNGMNELITAAKYMDRFTDPAFVVCVFNNRDLNQVTWEQRVLAGDPMFPGTQHIPDFPYARYAELVGFNAIRVDAPDQVGGAWDEAFSADRPTLVEWVVDREIPPLPPHIMGQQMKKMAEAMVKDPERWGVMEKSLRMKAQEFLPGR
jgi:pyruvate dehydrogenase (quinone)